MIGLGTQDSADEAAGFVRDRGTYSFPMYWDETYESWAALDITSQPAAILLAANGTTLGSWRGPFPESDVLRLARG